MLPYRIETMSPHPVMYISDYPLWDSEFPESVRPMAAISGLIDEPKCDVLGRHAVTWFDLTPGEFPEISVYF